MIAKMTYEEYREKALQSLRHYFEKDDNYIDELDKRGCIRRAYNQEVDVSEFLGSDQTSPSGFAYGCHMLYPNFPDGDEADTDKPVFDFKFNKARKS